MPTGSLSQTANATWVEPDCHAQLLFSLPFNANTTSLQDLTHLRGALKTASGKESFSSSYKRCSGWDTSQCQPKAGDATTWTTVRLQRWLSLGPSQHCPWQTDNPISYASFMVSLAWEWRSPIASSAPVLPLSRIDLDSSGNQCYLMN
jgi:hypothetical protein